MSRQKFSRQAALAVMVAVALGVGGYALTGSPRLPAAPAPARVMNPDLTPEAEQASKQLLNNYGDVRAWMTLSDALIRANRTETAVAAMDQALDAIPGDADLWVQMGISLVAHAQGEVAPAARLAFDRASRLAPDHPAPPYFLALAWMQSAEPAKALAVLRPLEARSPADAPWRPMVERMIRGAEAMLAAGMGAGGGQATGPAEQTGRTEQAGQAGQPVGRTG